MQSSRTGVTSARRSTLARQVQRLAADAADGLNGIDDICLRPLQAKGFYASQGFAIAGSLVIIGGVVIIWATR